MTLPLAPDSDLLPLGKGEVLVNRYDSNGALTYWRHLGNVESFEFNTEDDVLEKYSSMERSAPLYKRVTRRRNVNLTMVLSEYDIENLALVLMGESGELTQTAVAVTNEVVTASAKLGAYYQLAKFGPYTVGPVLEESVTPTTLVLGTDYVIVDSFLGIIQLLPTAVNIADGETMQADYTPTAYSTGATGIKTVKGGTKSLIEVAVKFISDPASGPKTHVDVWRASVSPNGALGLISEEWSTIQLTMAVQDDSVNNPTYPLYRMISRP